MAMCLEVGQMPQRMKSDLPNKIRPQKHFDLKSNRTFFSSTYPYLAKAS